MAELPTFISTARAPSTTGVGSLDYVPTQNFMGKQLQQLGGMGQKIADNIFQVENEQALSHSTLNAKIKLNGLRTELSKMKEPRQALDISESRIQKIYAESSEGLSDVALDSFNKTFNMLRAETSINIQKDYVNSVTDKAKANLRVGLSYYSKMFNSKAGKLENQPAYQNATNDINSLVKSGFLSVEEGTKKLLDWKEKFVKTGIDQLIRETHTDDLDDLVGYMSSNSFPRKKVGENGRDINEAIRSFWGQLDDTEKLKLQKEVVTMHESQLNIIDKSKNRLIAATKRNQATETAKLKKLIIQQKQPDAIVEDVTESVLLEKLEENKISYKQYFDLSADLIDKDPVADDYDAVRGLLSKIRIAETPNDLRDIIAEAENMLGSKGQLTFKTFQAIEEKAKAAMSNAPSEKRKAQYSKALNRIVSSADWLDKILPGAKDRAALIVLDFEARINGENPEDPADAFRNALDAFRTRGRVELNAIPKPQFGPTDESGEGMKPLGEWTLNDVLISKVQTRSKFRGKPSVLATQMIILNALQQYVRQNEADKEPPKTPKAPEQDSRAKPTPESRDKTLKELREGSETPVPWWWN